MTQLLERRVTDPHPRSIDDRIRDMLLFLLGMQNEVSLDNIEDAVEDLFIEYDLSERARLTEAASRMLRQMGAH
ncbi:hypothetical protein [Methylorubrum populi]